MIRIRRQLPLLALLASCIALSLPLVLLSGDTPYSFDETNFYVPAIRQIRADWPHLDLNRNSLSATAPGYQYLLASLSFVTGTSLMALRLLNLAISLGLPLLLWGAWPSEANARLRFWALVPLVGGCFFIRSASNVMTDNAALLASTGALTLILLPRFERWIAGAGGLVALSVMIRQITIWIEGPLLIRLVWLRRANPWWTALCAPIVLGWLILTWHGLVPPAWQSELGGFGYAAAPYQLAVLGVLGPFYYACVSPDWRSDLRDRWTLAGAFAGLILALVCPTAPSYDAGRWGGYFWNAAAQLPSVGQRSVLFFLLAPWGGWMLAALVRRLWQKTSPASSLIWLAAFFSFFVSGLLNQQVHQRYYEPVQLMLLIFWLILMVSSATQVPVTVIRLTPLVLLSFCHVFITFLTAYGRTFGFF